MSEEIMRQNMLVIAQTFATAKAWSLSTVSKKIHGDQGFFAKYAEDEVSPQISTYFRMLERFRKEWPKGTRWPITNPVGRPGNPYPTPALIRRRDRDRAKTSKSKVGRIIPGGSRAAKR